MRFLTQALFFSFILLSAKPLFSADAPSPPFIEKSVRVLRGIDPGVKLELGAEYAGKNVEILALRGHKNPDLIFSAANLYMSRASFVVPADGSVDFSRDAPKTGFAYRDFDGNNFVSSGVDPMAPYWTMATTPRDNLPEVLKNNSAEWQLLSRENLGFNKILFYVLFDNKIVAKTLIHYEALHPDIVQAPIDGAQENFFGKLYYPKSCEGEKCPGLVVWSGSGCGAVSDETIGFYAHHGIAVLSIRYCTMDAKEHKEKTYLPFGNREVPLEIFKRAIDWIQAEEKSKVVDSSRVAIMGGSRGAEAALLVGQYYYSGQRSDKSIVGIFAHRPHFLSVSSAVDGAKDVDANPLVETASWVYADANGNSQAVPYLEISSDPARLQDINQLVVDAGGETLRGEIKVERFIFAFADALRRFGPARIEANSIPVENIRVPLLVFGAGDDQMWPSAEAAKRISERRAGAAFAQDLIFTAVDAGHISFLPGTPAAESTESGHGIYSWVLGGTALANHRASIEFRDKSLQFLSSVFAQPLTMLRLDR